jgi:hypothetical protein
MNNYRQEMNKYERHNSYLHITSLAIFSVETFWQAQLVKPFIRGLT